MRYLILLLLFSTSLFAKEAKEESRKVTFTTMSARTAVKDFHIKMHKDVTRIILDPTLEDRGDTELLNGKFIIRLGKAAFESKAMLGSTIAHEIEIHCNQTWPSKETLINRPEIFEQMTSELEMAAYQYEADNQKRFGTTDSDVAGFIYYVEYFKKIIEDYEKDYRKQIRIIGSKI